MIAVAPPPAGTDACAGCGREQTADTGRRRVGAARASRADSLIGVALP